MAELYQIIDEQRAQLGIGAGLYMKNDSGLFSLLLPLESVPAFSASTETVEISVTTSPYNTKLDGKASLEDKEVDFFVHRDSLRKLESIKGKKVELLSVNPDFTGERTVGTISYVQQDRTTTDPTKGTIKVVQSEYIGTVDNVYDLLQPSCKFTSPIDAVVYMNSEETNKTYSISVTTDPSDATIEVKSEAEAVATVANTEGKVTITAVTKGSAVITIKATKEKYAPWETTVLVIVK